MSYILEALKKADADRERERSAVPSLHAHTDALGFERERRGGVALGARLAAGAVLLLAAGGLAWWLWAAPSTPDGERSIASAAPAPAAMVAPTPSTQQTAVPPAQPVATAPTTPSPVAVAPAVPAPSPAPVAPPPAARKTAPAAPGAAAPPRPPAEPRLPTRNELAPELRAALPPLNVSGAVYAPTSNGRMLFVNGLVLREGDAVSDGLSVERIGRASSVLVFRGQRFEVKH